MIENECELLEQTKLLAAEKGIDTEVVFCPYLETCEGLMCHLMVHYYLGLYQKDVIYQEEGGTKEASGACPESPWEREWREYEDSTILGGNR